MATAQRDSGRMGIQAGRTFILWPLPDSLYAKVKTDTGWAPGIAYCPDCAPEIGQPGPILEGSPIIGYEKALERYAKWFEPACRVFYSDWLAQAMGYGETDVNAFLELWDKDCRGSA